MLFPYTEAATGSLGQGLSIGLGMAINGKYLDNVPYKTFVLLGDSEMAEGSVWEAMQVTAHYNLNNLVAILDVNGLGQRESRVGEFGGLRGSRHGAHRLRNSRRCAAPFDFTRFGLGG